MPTTPTTTDGMLTENLNDHSQESESKIWLLNIPIEHYLRFFFFLRQLFAHFSITSKHVLQLKNGTQKINYFH